jgi:phage terminase Nu1 subunit (DNA packaging protein)
MTKVNLMTQAEYAKHRGCSGVSVHKAVKAGRISLIDGKIDPAVADIQWAANTRARVPHRKPDAKPAPAQSIEVPTPHANDQAPEGKTDDYWEARSRRETAEAAIAEMKAAEMCGVLIRTDAVRTAWANKITTARDALLQIPSRLAPVLAAEGDMERITELLEAELRQALMQLSESKQSEVTV